MAWTTIAAIYFIMWWIVLFAVLPWGVRSQTEHGEEVPPGTDPGAPVGAEAGAQDHMDDDRHDDPVRAVSTSATSIALDHDRGYGELLRRCGADA